MLHFIQCSDDDCASAADTYVAEGSDDGIASIAVASDGTSYIVWDDGNDFGAPYNTDGSDSSEYTQGVGLATCAGGGCTTSHIASINIADGISAVITIGADANPAILRG